MLRVIEGGTEQYDENGKVIEDWSTCGYCGATWNDAIISSMTPAPSGRCPFEYEHKSRPISRARFTHSVNEAAQLRDAGRGAQVWY